MGSAGACQAAAERIAETTQATVAAKGRAVLGLATGATPEPVYARLVALHRAGGLSFADVITYNLDEYYPISPADSRSYRAYMHEHLFAHVDIAPNRTHVLDGTIPERSVAEHAAEFLIQEQIRDGVEMIVGVTHDPAFGPLVLAGLGGTFVEVLGDVAVRITPLSDTDVDVMLRSLRSYRLLTGYRQSPLLDVAAFAELLHRVSAMVEDIPEITELDLNPVFVRQHGAIVADIRVRLTGPTPEPAT